MKRCHLNFIKGLLLSFGLSSILFFSYAEISFGAVDIKNDESLGDQSLISSWLSDESGLSTDLVTLTGNNLDSNGEPMTVAGKQGMAAVFDGLDDSLQILDSDQVGLDFSGGSDMSWNFWLYKTNDGEDIILSKWNHVGATQYFIVVNTSPSIGYAQIYMSDTVSGFGYKNVGTPSDVKHINNNQWHMISVAYDASEKNIEIWIDGVSRVSGNGNGIEPTISDTDVKFMLAGRDSGGGEYSGKLNQVTAWNKVITQADVDKLWNQGEGIPYEVSTPQTFITLSEDVMTEIGNSIEYVAVLPVYEDLMVKVVRAYENGKLVRADRRLTRFQTFISDGLGKLLFTQAERRAINTIIKDMKDILVAEG